MIRLDGVCVPLTDQPYLGYNAYDHQAAAENLLTSTDEFFALNASPTGSGKTFSWLKPALEEGIDTIAIFPTNALIADQVEAARELTRKHFGEDVEIVEATGETVAEWRDAGREGQVSKGKTLRRQVQKALEQNRVTVLCTNPDILTLIRRDMYNHHRLKQHSERFEMLVADEFHLADVKQRDTLLFLMDEMYSTPEAFVRTNRFYLLSATLERDETGRPLGKRIREDIGVSPVEITADARPAATVSSDKWRQIMPPIDLDLRTAPTFRTADELLSDSSRDEFVSFCSEAQTVVMVDGVDEVDRLYEMLDEQLDGTVRRITGFNRGNVREKIESFDVLVSNSAVEVGLDFQPEQLVFSAHDSPTLVQRLGRLRDRDDDSNYRAWCYVPDSVHASLEHELRSQEQPIPRTAFERAATEAFASGCDYSSYSWRWADLEAYHHVKNQVESTTSDQADQVYNEGVDRIRRHFYEPYDRSLGKSNLERLEDGLDYRLLDRLQSYRGEGLQVMVRDHVAGEIKLYNIFYILRWGRVQFRSRRAFRESLDSEERRFYDGYASYAVGFCEYFGKVDTDYAEDGEYAGRSVTLHDGGGRLHDLKEQPDAQRPPVVTDGLQVEVDQNSAPTADGISRLNDEMFDHERLCYVLPGNPNSNKSVYDFGDFFFVYPMDDASITLGTTALYAHCLVQDRVEAEATERDWSWD